MANINNLKPFTGASDPRRQNGRKKGSKNLSTIVIELLGEEMDSNILVGEGPRKYLGNSPTTYMKALAKTMIAKAINGDVRAATWVSNYADRQPAEEGFFDKTKIVFEVVPAPKRPEGESQV